MHTNSRDSRPKLTDRENPMKPACRDDDETVRAEVQALRESVARSLELLDALLARIDQTAWEK